MIKMHFNVKAILGLAENIAVATVPGAAGIDKAAHEVIDAKSGADKENAIFDSFMASVDTLEVFKPELIANDDEFKAAVIDMHHAIDRMKASLKK